MVDREQIHPWRWRLVYVWIIAFTITTFYTLHEVKAARTYNCHHISGIFRNIVIINDKSLGKPGTQGYAYFKSHPEEISRTHKANRKLINELDPSKCK